MSNKTEVHEEHHKFSRGTTKRERPTAQKMPEFGDNPKYKDLERVLTLAYDQAAHGKGAERHAGQEARGFADQPINTIPMSKSFLVGLGGLSYQIEKKCGEADRMCERAAEHCRISLTAELSADMLQAARKETLGVIVYAAAKYLHIEREMERVESVLYDPMEEHE